MTTLFSTAFLSKKLFKLSLFSLILTLCLGLTGCVGVRVELGTDVTFYENERWAATVNIKLPPTMKPFLEQAERQNPGGLEADLAKLESEGKANGVDTTVSHQYLPDDSFLITMASQGQGLAALKAMAFSPEADLTVETVNGQRQINLRYIPRSEVQGMMVVTNTLRLTGGQVITSNATRIEGNTAIWENPQQVEVTLTESSGFSVWTILGSVAACAGLGMATLFVGSGVAAGVYWYRQRATGRGIKI
ncbi:MAG: hypothetical protein HS114_24265 [Anaerolineales bacterium]|nr:hypothetical protein [Anaerolineales bacterium]